MAPKPGRSNDRFHVISSPEWDERSLPEISRFARNDKCFERQGKDMKIKCPSCKYENIEGEDRCEKCFDSLMQRDIPRPSKKDTIQNVIMTAPISELITGEDLLVASTSD
jgi:hypothetical protein